MRKALADKVLLLKSIKCRVKTRVLKRCVCLVGKKNKYEFWQDVKIHDQ